MKLRSLFTSCCLILLSNTASASIIADDIANVSFETLTWTGNCSDCLGVKGDDSFSNPTPVSGNIVLDGYVAGEEFFIDSSNFVSLQYDGPSDHVDQLVIHNADYSDSDDWYSNADMIFELIDDIGFWGTGSQADEFMIDGYTHFSESMDVAGWIAEDMSEYWLDLSFFTYAPIDFDTGEYVKYSTLSPEDEVLFILQEFEISYFSSGDWSITANGIPFDIGNNAQVSLANVPEPSSIAIFTAGLFALVRLRRKP